MVLQQLGRPVSNPPYHPDGPPWLAGLGLRHWYTRLVYPQHILSFLASSATSAAARRSLNGFVAPTACLTFSAAASHGVADCDSTEALARKL
jgi:hypothetical protein